MAGHAGPPIGPASDVVLPLHSLKKRGATLIGGIGGEAKGCWALVGPGREGLMALASAGCEMLSSSYTAGPRSQLSGLWAAELASVASTQALQRDGRRDCEAGGSGRRRGWARARNRLARSARWLRSGEARARMAGRAGSAYGEPPNALPRFPRSLRPSNRKGSAGSPMFSVCQT